VDTLTPKERSARMALVRSKGTTVEMKVRRLMHALGYRYRLHGADLPGRPDMVLRSRQVAVFAHGCFWHRHPRCKLARLPKSRLDFWVPKLEANRARDVRNLRKLRRAGWRPLVVWECELSDPTALKLRIKRFLTAKGNS
jgi:DNA mismatch endonuclease (patch repair protein)